MSRTDTTEGTAEGRPRRTLSIQLQASDVDAFERIQQWFPPGTMSVSRIARLAIRHGIERVEADLRAAAVRIASEPSGSVKP
jgi:hypothetical protein